MTQKSRIIGIGTSKGRFHAHVHCSITQNSPDTETTLVFAHLRKGKGNGYIPTKDCDVALEKQEIPSVVTTQMNLEDITLRGISQSQKDKYCMISLI